MPLATAAGESDTAMEKVRTYNEIRKGYITNLKRCNPGMSTVAIDIQSPEDLGLGKATLQPDMVAFVENFQWNFPNPTPDQRVAANNVYQLLQRLHRL